VTTQQIILFGLLFFVFVFLIWGRWRYDLVAFTALLAAVMGGVVPVDKAFSGFGHPATVVIALVLIVSRALSNSGAIELLARYVANGSRKIGAHISIMSTIAAGLSAAMNNVAALALLMPVDIEAAARAKRSPALTLMPLSFATILGGMITLIGTPPNIVIAEYRAERFGAPFSMFDFAPVGGVCAVVGVLFIATVGWRLIPAARGKQDSSKELFELENYIAEVRVPEGAPAIGKTVAELDDAVQEHEAAILGLVRRGQRMPGTARNVEIREGDLLVVESAPEGIDRMVGELKLEYVRPNKETTGLTGDGLSLIEVVVPEGSRIEGRSALSLGLLRRHEITLLGVSRQGRRFSDRVRKLEIKAGDILLLLGSAEGIAEISQWLGCLPLAGRGLQVVQRRKAGLAVGIFVAAILAASLGWLYLPIALAIGATLMVLMNIVPIRQLYESVEWSVIVLLGSMIPIGAAFESSGSTILIAQKVVQSSEGFPPAVVLLILMVVTMCLSDVMNNTATAVIAAPVAVTIAEQLGVNADPFLMAVAVAASCAFLTPIGHKNNTLILGPGGYRFGDYWRMGLPLEILIVAVATPMIVTVHAPESEMRASKRLMKSLRATRTERADYPPRLQRHSRGS
jgi:di/tricarboxylate transporter